jgi:hypothetical protein
MSENKDCRREWPKMKWTEDMVGDLHTGVWHASWIGDYKFVECISVGSLYWTIRDLTMKIVHPRGEQIGFTIEDAKELAEKHRLIMCEIAAGPQ